MVDLSLLLEFYSNWLYSCLLLWHSAALHRKFLIGEASQKGHRALPRVLRNRLQLQLVVCCATSVILTQATEPTSSRCQFSCC